MMTLKQYLLNHLMEECSEVQKAASKCNRFGLTHFWANEKKLNRVALRDELLDVMVLARELESAGVIDSIVAADVLEHSKATSERRLRVFEMSVKMGHVEGP